MEQIFNGFLVSLSLIIAIGSQNIFILRQGLAKNNVFYVCLISFVCDIFLISLGILGIGEWISTQKEVISIFAILGSVYLLYYGANAFYHSYKGDEYIKTKTNKKSEKSSRKKIIYASFAMALLNPHVYLDTVVIMGGISATLESDTKIYFLLGALIASFTWIFGLGYGSKFLAPLFAKKNTWRILDFIIGIIMFSISYNLISFVLIQ